VPPVVTPSYSSGSASLPVELYSTGEYGNAGTGYKFNPKGGRRSRLSRTPRLKGRGHK
jgi:hypothetical protein